MASLGAIGEGILRRVIPPPYVCRLSCMLVENMKECPRLLCQLCNKPVLEVERACPMSA